MECPSERCPLLAITDGRGGVAHVRRIVLMPRADEVSTSADRASALTPEPSAESGELHPTLAAVLEHEDPEARRRLAESLARLGDGDPPRPMVLARLRVDPTRVSAKSPQP